MSQIALDNNATSPAASHNATVSIWVSDFPCVILARFNRRPVQPSPAKSSDFESMAFLLVLNAWKHICSFSFRHQIFFHAFSVDASRSSANDPSIFYDKNAQDTMRFILVDYPSLVRILLGSEARTKIPTVYAGNICIVLWYRAFLWQWHWCFCS